MSKTPAMRPALVQLPALLALRWQMVRSTGGRLALLACLPLLAWLVQLVVTSSSALDGPQLATAVELAPSVFLGFGVLAVVAPLTTGGGNEVVPPDQLAAFPVRPGTQFLGGLVLAPLNLVWVLQLLGLAALTGYLTLDSSLARGAATTAAYVACLTVLGQAGAWLVVGLRQTRIGRRVVGTSGVLLLLTAILVVRSGSGDAVLAASPTHSVVRAVTADSTARWAATTAGLLLLLAVGLVVGSRLCAWALGRPGDAGTTRHLETLRRRAPRSSVLRELVAVDRASVWRSPPLRRGALVLAVLPGLIAAGAAVPWTSLIVLPGLVAAGAGLLFGVNAFCLDSSGALWLASLPHPPRVVAVAKAVVMAETVAGAVIAAAVAGSLRSPGSPTSAEVTAIVMAGLASTAVVVASGLRSSVRRPHRADLRGPRDAVAPPAALALASLRLAVPTGLVGVLLASAAATRVWWLPIAVGGPVVLAAGLSLSRTLRRYEDPVVRSHVVQTVAAG